MGVLARIPSEKGVGRAAGSVAPRFERTRFGRVPCVEASCTCQKSSTLMLSASSVSSAMPSASVS
jgi:hypothetical protein